MNGILKQMKKIKHALAVMLCMALLLEGTGMQVLAETTSDVLNDVAAVSDVENASSGGTTDGGTIDGEEDEPESDAPVMASGNYCEGVTWTLYEDGLLVVKGTAANNTAYNSTWLQNGYRVYVKNAKVRIKEVRTLSGLFSGFFNLETVDFAGSDTSKVTSMSRMFESCPNLTSVNMEGCDTSNVTSMEAMFLGCYQLQDVNLSSFNTEKVTSVQEMFQGCCNLEILDLSSFSLPNVTRAANMLNNAYIKTIMTPRNLKVNVPIDFCTGYGINNTLPTDCETSKVLTLGIDPVNNETEEYTPYSGTCCEGITWSLTNKGHLIIEGTAVDSEAYLNKGWQSFWVDSGAYGTAINLSQYIVSADVRVAGVSSLAGLFSGCLNLENVDFTGSDTASVTNMSNMFFECRNLKSMNMSCFDTSSVTNMGSMFYQCSNLESVNMCGLDLSNVADMNHMFYGCHDLENIDLTNIDTNNVTDMRSMFSGCGSLDSLDLRNLDTGNVTNMRSMFDACNNLLSIDLGDLDTSNVMNMNSMFYNCRNLESIDLSNWDTSNVTDMLWMFNGCSSLKSLDMSELETNNVTDMSSMFYNCSSLESINLSNLDTSNVTDMMWMFNGCSSLKSLDMSDLETNNVTSMSGMFNNCSSLENINLSNLDTSNVTDMGSMFSSCSSLENINLSNLDTSNVTDMGSMFSSCSSLESINLSNLDTSNVTDMGSMFSRCSSLTSIDFGNLNTSNVTDMGSMFGRCSSLTGINLSNLDTSNVTDMGWMFCDCSSLTSIDLSNLDTSNVTDMNRMFWNCSSLISVDMSNLKVSKVIDMDLMFQDCVNLENIDLSGMDTSSVTSIRQMFNGCEKLKCLDLSSFDTSNVTYMNGMFSDCSNLQRLDLSSFDMSNITSSMWNWVNSLENLRIIKTPKNLSSNIRIGNLSHTMYDKSGNAYTTLPTDLAESITLVSDMSIFDELEEEETPGGDVTGGDVTGGDVTGGDTPGGNDKPEGGATNDGNDKPEGGSTNDGNDQPEGSTNDGNDKPEGGDATDTNDGDDKTEDDKEDDNTGDSDTSEDEDIPRVLAIEPIADQFYTGKALKPEVIVTYGKDVLSLGKDYTVSYKNNTNAAKADSAKAPVAIVKGKGNFEGTITVAFNIIAKELTESNMDISEMLSYENGTKQTVKPVVKLNGKKLTEGKDFVIEYSDLTEGAYEKPGTYSIVIKGVNNYQGSIVTVMTILSENQVMASKLKVGKIAAYDYKENEPATPAPAVSYKGKELVLDKDYSISYRNNDRAGKATLIITGLKNTDAEGTYVAGTLKKTFTIKGTPLKKAGVNYEQKVNYTGVAICPTVTLTMDGKELVPGKDYTVAYAKNVNVGKATIILTGQGGYTGTVKKTFTIQADASVADKLEVTFAGGKAEASYSAKGAKPAITVTLGDAKLKLGKDYTVSYKNNKKLAEANAAKAPTVIIKGKGNYKFTKNVTFAIVPKNLADADMSIVSTDKFVGSKKGYISAPVIKDENGKKLKANKDYTIVGYTVNGEQFEGTGEVAAGTVVTVTVQGKDNYTGTAITTYRVANNDISKTNVNKPQLEYNGGKVKFTEEMLKEGKLEITDKATGKKLVYGTDFIVTGYKNNTKKGTATVTVQGIGEYGGTKNVKFSIVSKKLDKK